MTVKELIDELNKIAIDDRQWLNSKVIIVAEKDNHVFEADIKYLAENSDGVVTIEC